MSLYTLLLRFVRGVFSLSAATRSLRYLYNLCVISDPPSSLLRYLRLLRRHAHLVLVLRFREPSFPPSFLRNLRLTA